MVSAAASKGVASTIPPAFICQSNRQIRSVPPNRPKKRRQRALQTIAETVLTPRHPGKSPLQQDSMDEAETRRAGGNPNRMSQTEVDRAAELTRGNPIMKPLPSESVLARPGVVRLGGAWPNCVIACRGQSLGRAAQGLVRYLDVLGNRDSFQSTDFDSSGPLGPRKNPPRSARGSPAGPPYNGPRMP